MTRKDALLKLQNKPYDTETIKNDFEYISNKLSIDVSELKKYFQMPKKTYKDYKSQELIYNLGAIGMRMLGLEKGGKR